MVRLFGIGWLSKSFSTRRQFANYGQTRWNNSMRAIASLIEFRDSNLDSMLKDSIVNDSYERMRLGVLKPVTYSKEFL